MADRAAVTGPPAQSTYVGAAAVQVLQAQPQPAGTTTLSTPLYYILYSTLSHSITLLLLHQDFPFSLVPGTGQLALRFDETAMRIVSDDIKSVQRKDIAPWIMALPMLFDPKVSSSFALFNLV